MTKRILHIDDDPDMLRLVAYKLNAVGYEVTSKESANNLPAAISESRAKLVILDIDMPDKDGIAALREIKSIDGGLQVIMLTGLVKSSTVLNSLQLGAEACIFKPIVSFDPLLEVVENSFLKIEKWWAAIEELRSRKKVVSQALAENFA